MSEGPRAVPLVWSRSAGFCSSTAHGTQLVELRAAHSEALASGVVLEELREQLDLLGSEAQLRVWMIPASAQAGWNASEERFMRVCNAIALASEGTSRNASILCGELAPDPAIVWCLRSCGHCVCIAAADARPPVLEVRLDSERVVAGIHGVQELG